MQAIHVRQKVEQDGKVSIRGLPCHKGQEIELVVLIANEAPPSKMRFTGGMFLRSGLVGLWKGQKGLGASSGFARKLRQSAQGIRVR